MYAFVKSVRPYRGDLVTLESDGSRTRVTPNHVVRVRFNEQFENRWVVYLMRRGDWWRVGVTTSANRPYKAGGVGGRLATEQADAGWVLGVYDDRKSALIAEEMIRNRYGVPGLTFRGAKGRSLNDDDLAAIHTASAPYVGVRVKALLDDFGILEDSPLYRRGDQQRRNLRGWFDTAAANTVALTGRIDVPVAVPREVPVACRALVTTSPYDGPVYGLDVPPMHYYVSGGAVVHNSVKGGQADCVYLIPDLSSRGSNEWRQKGGPQDGVRRQIYVGMTRARRELVVCAASTGMHVSPEQIIAGARKESA